MSFRSSISAAFAVALTVAPVAAQSRPDTLRGKVMADSVTPIAGATVTVTRAPDRLVQRTETDASGNWQMVYAEGTGDYLVHAIATGFSSARKRIQYLAGKLPQPVLTLKSTTAQELAPVRVSAEKPRPEREDYPEIKPGGNDSFNDGVFGALPPALAGDLNAMLSLTPGVVMTANGPSVLGASASAASLGGMGFTGSSVPRDAKTSVSVSTGSADPSNGWFSAFRTNVDLEQGNMFAFRRLSVTVDAPFMQMPSSGTDARFSNYRISTGGDGMFFGERTAYNYGVEAFRRSAPFLSVESAGPASLRAAGIAPDSVARFLQLLIPGRTREFFGALPAATSQEISFMGRVDRAGYDFTTQERRTTVLGAIGFFNVSKSDGLGGGALASRERSAESSRLSAGTQGIFSKYLRERFLTDLRSGISISRNEQKPAVNFPGANVTILSGDNEAGAANISFGGSGYSSNATTTLWETTSKSYFYFDKASRNYGILTGDLRLDGFRDAPQSNINGTFSYNSLADLAQNIPASFSRSFNPSEQTGGEWNGFLSLSDQFRFRKAVRFMLGARVEGNHFTFAPERNVGLEQAFGVRNDVAPNSFHISPRAGFTWVRSGQFMQTVTGLGHFRVPPTDVLRASIGEYREFVSPTLLARAAQYSGLPGSTRELNCIGASTPIPDWTGFVHETAAPPSECVGGAVPTAFRDASPAVSLVDPEFRPSRSWRVNFGYGRTIREFPLSVDLTYSLNLDQRGISNLNFSNTLRFTSSGDNRPVFVAPGEIVTRTGQMSSAGSRLTSQFGSVLQTRSNLRSTAAQLMVSAHTPRRMFANYLSAAYTLGRVRSQENGFDGTTFGSPVTAEWGRSGSDVRHQIVMQFGHAFRKKFMKGVTLGGSAVIQSGIPFTPVAGSDVNGDGFANDRAFIAPNAAGCLSSQAGKVASRNSCEGPWTVLMNAQFNKSFETSKFGQTGNVSLAFANPIGALDHLLHGSDKMHGWGGTQYPDRVLYSVNGFDPATKKFTYVPNPGFGKARPGYSGIASPFRVTLDVRLDIGKSMNEQQVNRWLRPGRGKPGVKLSVAELKLRYARNVADPYQPVLRESDSLLLSREQADEIRAAQKQHAAAMDSLWSALSEKLYALPDNFDANAALDLQEAAIDQAWEMGRQSVKANLPRILSPVQIEMLPSGTAFLLKTEGKIRFRMYMY